MKLNNWYCMTLILLFVNAAYGLESEIDPSLFQMSFEDLLKVKVTSRKKEEDPNKVPVGLTVFTRKELKVKNIDSLFQLADHTPNFSWHESFNRTNSDRPVIRGLSNIVGEPNAGIFVDGIYVAGNNISMPIEFLERVEINRGPQAALYGRSTFDGAINLVSRIPDSKFQQGYTLSAAQYDEVKVNLYVNIPISDSFIASLSASKYQYGGSWDNELGTGGEGIASEATQAIANQLLWKPSNNISLTFRLHYQEDLDGHNPVYLQTSEYNNCYEETATGYFCGKVKIPDKIGLNLDKEYFNDGVSQKFARTNLTMNGKWLDNNWSGMVASNLLDRSSQYDSDFIEKKIAFRDQEAKFLDQSQEIRIASPEGNTMWSLGASFYQETKTERNRNTFIVAGEPLVSLADKEITEISNQALFATLSQTADVWTIDGELRIAEDKISQSQKEGTSPKHSESWQSLAPKLSLHRELHESEYIYATIGRGHKPGGIEYDIYDILSTSPENEFLKDYTSYDKEYLTSYELGWKGQHSNSKIKYSAALFYIDITNMHVTQNLSYLAQGATKRITVLSNDGSAHIYGLEGEYTSQILSNLLTSFSLGYSKTRFDNYNSVAQEILTGDSSVKGKQFPNSPLYTGSLGLQYEDLMSEGISYWIHGDFLYESSRFSAEHNLAETGETVRLNASVGLKNANWDLSLWGKQLNEPTAVENISRFGDPNTGFVKRAFGLTLPKKTQYGLTVSYNI